jgi:CheY-like chemotaxis protein
MAAEIFVVDDDVDYQFIFFKLLKELDTPHSVKFFANASACHKHILQNKCTGTLPALMVLDLNMPGLNGLQLLRMLRCAAETRINTIPVIIMSSDISRDEVQQCYQAGANAVIAKPTDYKTLKYIVQSIYKFWLDRAAK